MDDRIEGWLRLDYGVESVRSGDIRDDAEIEGCAGFWEVFEDLIGFGLGAHDGADGVGGFEEEGEDV